MFADPLVKIYAECKTKESKSVKLGLLVLNICKRTYVYHIWAKLTLNARKANQSKDCKIRLLLLPKRYANECLCTISKDKCTNVESKRVKVCL